MISRLFEALLALGCIAQQPYGESANLVVTNMHHVSIGIRSERSLRIITEALEAAAEKASP